MNFSNSNPIYKKQDLTFCEHIFMIFCVIFNKKDHLFILDERSSCYV